jgi:hypothetical protein
MRSNTFIKLGLIGLSVILNYLALDCYSQAKGNLTFTTSLTQHNGSYGNSHVVAVWIEDSSNSFVKTNLRMAMTNHTINNHLPVWKNVSGLDVTDAITGATLRSYSSPVSISWDGTNVSGTIVKDGLYSVWIEESWDEGSSGTSSNSVSFTKSTKNMHLSPANTANFTSISLDWISSDTSSTSIKNPVVQNDIGIYPNPSNGLFYADFKTLVNITAIEMTNIKGQIVYSEKINKAVLGVRHFNFQNYASGTYFLNFMVENGKNVLRYNIVLNTKKN